MARKQNKLPQSNNQLLKDLTHYGSGFYLSDMLYYSSDRSVEQYKKMRMYPMCWLGLSFIKLGLSDIPFIIECEENEDIQAATTEMMKRIWKKMVREALESLDFGFKAMEIRYEVGTLKYKLNDQLKELNGFLFKSPKGLDGETINIMIEPDDGSFRGFSQDSVEVLAKKRKALLFTNTLESGNYYGISAMEPVYPYWYDANINRQFHMRWLEKKGTGIFKGYYPDGNSEVSGEKKENSDIMLDLLDGIMEGTAVAIPSKMDEHGNRMWDIEELDPGDKTDPFINRANYIDEMVLKGMVIPEKALTQGEIGARSSIEAFQDMFIMRKQAVLDEVVSTIDKYMLPNFVELNYGPGINVRIKPGKLDDNSKEVADKIVEKLIEKGIHKVDRMWLIEKTGIPLEEEEEPEEENIPEETEGVEIEEEEKEDETEVSEKDKKKVEKEAKKKEKNEKKNLGKEKKLSDAGRWRNLNARENLFQLSQINDFCDECSERFQLRLAEQINIQVNRIKKYIDKNYPFDKAVEAVNGIKIAKGPINSIFRNYLTEIYNKTFNKIKAGVEKNVNFAAGDTANKFIGLRISLTADKFANDLETAIKFQVNNDIDLSKIEMKERINEMIDDFIRIKIPNTAETELGFTLDKAIDDYTKENKKLVKSGKLPLGKEIKRFQYSAILDDKTCPLCMELDGTITKEGSSFMVKFSPPIHYSCRCVFLPITQDEIDNPNIPDTDYTDTKGKKIKKPLTADQVTIAVGDNLKLKTFSCANYGGT